MMTGDAEALAEDAKGLNLEEEEQQDEEVMQDIEDAGEGAEQEIQEDNNAANQDHSSDDSEDEIEDHDRKHRSNPLQMVGRDHLKSAAQEKVEVEDDHDVNLEQDSNIASTAEIVEGDTHDEDEADNKSTPGPGPNAETSSMKPLHPQTKLKQKEAPPKRGANTKAAKRRAAKYALQDEEDRALAMELLGSTKARERKQAEDDAKLARQEKLEHDRARRRAQHQKAAEAEKARQERLARQAENGEEVLHDDDEIEGDQTAIEMQEHLNIDLLVPSPEPGDELIAAVPVVAPWHALGRCKYKVKLQPGNMKKGKALKEVIGVWSGLGNKGPKVVDEKNQDKEKVWLREVELVKQWRVEEIVGVLPVRGVRVVQGGGLAGQAATAGSAGRSRGNPARGKGTKKR